MQLHEQIRGFGAALSATLVRRRKFHASTRSDFGPRAISPLESGSHSRRVSEQIGPPQELAHQRAVVILLRGTFNHQTMYG